MSDDQPGAVTRAWRWFRSLPMWAQVLVWVALVVIVAAAAAGPDEGDESASSTTTERPAAATTTAQPSGPSSTDPAAAAGSGSGQLEVTVTNLRLDYQPPQRFYDNGILNEDAHAPVAIDVEMVNGTDQPEILTWRLYGESGGGGVVGVEESFEDDVEVAPGASGQATIVFGHLKIDGQPTRIEAANFDGEVVFERDL